MISNIARSSGSWYIQYETTLVCGVGREGRVIGKRSRTFVTCMCGDQASILIGNFCIKYM